MSDRRTAPGRGVAGHGAAAVGGAVSSLSQLRPSSSSVSHALQSIRAILPPTAAATHGDMCAFVDRVHERMVEEGMVKVQQVSQPVSGRRKEESDASRTQQQPPLRRLRRSICLTHQCMLLSLLL